jgi:dipeptidase E
MICYDYHMKLLLTSAGIVNDSIAQSLFALVDKKPADIKLAFIPTAANIQEGNKAPWLFRQYEDLRQLGIGWIDMVDFADADVDWQSRLDECDAFYLTGGNTFYLLDQIRKQGFDKYLEKTHKDKVYIGGSASSITMTPTIDVATILPADPNLTGITDLTGLGYVDFEIEPHCDTARFIMIKEFAALNNKKIYAIDDQTAIQVIDGSIEVISEGDWQLFE